MTRVLFGCASLNDCGWTGPQVGRNKEGTEFCPNCGGFVAQRNRQVTPLTSARGMGASDESRQEKAPGREPVLVRYAGDGRYVPVTDGVDVPAPLSEERLHELATAAGFGFFGQWQLYQGARAELVAFARAVEAARGVAPTAEAHQWEEADDLTLAHAEVLSLIGLLAELDRMEQENKDDALGGYCGAKVADFKRRYREAIARNGGVKGGS